MQAEVKIGPWKCLEDLSEVTDRINGILVHPRPKQRSNARSGGTVGWCRDGNRTPTVLSDMRSRASANLALIIKDLYRTKGVYV